MVPGIYEPRYVVRRIPGNGTGGYDDILIDNRGDHWKVYVGARMTGQTLATLTDDGLIKP